MMVCTVEHLNQLIVDALPRIRQLPFDVVVHLPRSGTLPATLIATYLRKPLASVDEFCAGMVNTRKSEFKDLKRILVVDDSIRTGIQISKALERIALWVPGAKISTFMVYSTPHPDRMHLPTMALFEHGSDRYIYPWFLWKSKRIIDCAIDMDGVLCRDATREEDDDGDRYQGFLKNVDLKFHTPYKIGAIITSRLEKYRPETEAWLRRHGISYDKLIMGPWANKKERKLYGAAQWKGSVYNLSRFDLYIESSAKDAPIISAQSCKRVFCIDNQKVYG